MESYYGTFIIDLIPYHRQKQRPALHPLQSQDQHPYWILGLHLLLVVCLAMRCLFM